MNHTLALVRSLPASFAEKALRSNKGIVIDQAKAGRQHLQYTKLLQSILGKEHVIHCEPLNNLPDSCFVEDTIVALDGIPAAIRIFMGAPSRRDEQETTCTTLSGIGWTVLQSDKSGEYLDGGDVLYDWNGRYVVGLSSRTNALGAKRFAQLAKDYKPSAEVAFLNVPEGLHLKSICSFGGPGVLILWENATERFKKSLTQVLKPKLCIEVPDIEAANVLWIPKREGFQETHHTIIRADHQTSASIIRRALESCSINVYECDMSELAKADGALTCCSVLLQPRIIKPIIARWATLGSDK